MIVIAVLGVLQIIAGAFVWIKAMSAIHEILAALLIGFGLLTISLAILASRLDVLIREAQATGRDLFALRHPEVPWPALPPSRVVHHEWRGQEHWRMRADGHWEVKGSFGKWKLADADHRGQR